MNTRERFVRCCRFQEVDRAPMVEIGVWGQAFDRWLKEGMPRDADWDFNVLKASELFGLEGFVYPEVNVTTCPRFAHTVLEEDEETYVLIDQDGARRRRMKTGMGVAHATTPSMDQFLAFAVENRADFEKIQERFDPDHAGRFPEGWCERAVALQESGQPLATTPNGGFGLYSMLRRWMGTENACTIFYDDPPLAEEMLEFLTEFFLRLSDNILQAIKPDWQLYFEDFAFKTGPLVSPMIFERFMLSRYRRLNDHLRARGIDIIAIDSDGNTEVLLPLLIEAGFNLLLPMEQAAGMDAVRIRKEYGTQLAMLGSIDKRPLAQGRKEIEAEILRQVPFLLETGGYIPTVDHTVPPDVSYENFLHYLDVKRKVLEGRYGA